MGKMNAMGWLLVVGASPSTDELWDFASELMERLGDRVAGDYPGLHGFTLRERETNSDVARYCFHPTGEPFIEFRSDDLHEVLLAGCTYLAGLMPENEMWRRD